jgi:hypothetical protein
LGAYLLKRITINQASVCSRCDRKGQYRKETLLALHGPDVTMPDLRHLIAECDRHGIAPESGDDERDFDDGALK